MDTSLLDQIRLSRENTWLQMRSILDTAQRHKRDVSSGEQARYNELDAQLGVLDVRMSEVSDLAERNSKADVVRHPIVQRIVDAYEKRQAVDDTH